MLLCDRKVKGENAGETKMTNEDRLESRRDKGRTQIIEAARKLFSTRGFHQTAMSELATEAQVSVGQVYRLFKSKSDVILAIVQDDIDDKSTQMMELVEGVRSGGMEPVEAFTKLAYVTLNEEDEALTFEILAEGHRSLPVAEAIQTICARYREILRELAANARPGLSAKSLDAAEELLLACMFGISHSQLSSPRLSVDEIATQTARMIMGALSALD